MRLFPAGLSGIAATVRRAAPPLPPRASTETRRKDRRGDRHHRAFPIRVRSTPPALLGLGPNTAGSVTARRVVERRSPSPEKPRGQSCPRGFSRHCWRPRSRCCRRGWPSTASYPSCRNGAARRQIRSPRPKPPVHLHRPSTPGCRHPILPPAARRLPRAYGAVHTAAPLMSRKVSAVCSPLCPGRALGERGSVRFRRNLRERGSAPGRAVR